MPPNRFESEVESFLEGSHGDRTHIKRADHPRLHHYAGHYSSGPSGALHTSGAWCADGWLGASARCPARPRRRPRAPPPGPVDQVGRLSETVIAFACRYLCGSETGIAFAGAKWAYLVHFSGAVVMLVSAGPCWG